MTTKPSDDREVRSRQLQAMEQERLQKLKEVREKNEKLRAFRQTTEARPKSMINAPAWSLRLILFLALALAVVFFLQRTLNIAGIFMPLP